MIVLIIPNTDPARMIHQMNMLLISPVRGALDPEPDPGPEPDPVPGFV